MKILKSAFTLFLSLILLIPYISAGEVGVSGNGADGENALLTVLSESGNDGTIPTAASAPPFDVDAKSAILIEASTGTVLYEKNADEALPPASVTKIMTLLLTVEAIDRGELALTDTVQVSTNAASMGGSQVYLEPGEEMTIDELLKSVAVASANDAAVALAEKVAGTEESFVALMNSRAAELGMTKTRFENPTGLDDDTTSHLTSARDISIMSRELMRHELILNYTTIWMDSIRNGEFGLTNTNRLIRFYNGANGLKTGSTSKALFCISAAAKRDGMQLIAVIMGSPTRDIRNEAAKKLLDYGFASCRYVSWEGGTPEPVKVVGGVCDSVPVKYDGYETVVKKSGGSGTTVNILLPETLDAPVHEGDTVGTVEYRLGDEVLATGEIKAAASVERIGYFGLLRRLLTRFFLG